MPKSVPAISHEFFRGNATWVADSNPNRVNLPTNLADGLRGVARMRGISLEDLVVELLSRVSLEDEVVRSAI